MLSRPLTRLQPTRMAASSRLAALSAHFSSSASAPSAPAKMSPNAAAEQPVLFEAIHSLRKVTLNRPNKLNVLNSEIVLPLKEQMEKWEASELASVVLLKGNGRAFCAGGDVVALATALEDKSKWADCSSFFHKEYELDGFIAKMKTPVVSILHGASMGGGLGLSVHGPFRVATESTRLAMPETKIGLFPDVGASFFLSRLDGNLGLYLGLTGQTIDGVAAYYAGYATHFVPGDSLQALEARLAELEAGASTSQINAAINEFVADKKELEAAGKYELVGVVRKAIDSIFGLKTAEEIVAALAKLEASDLSSAKFLSGAESPAELSSLQSWAAATRAAIHKGSPTSVKLALLAIREAKLLDIEEAFLMDLRLATACCNPELHPDFKTGVTHQLVTKSKERAAWQPNTLEEVSLQSLRSTFFSNPPPFSNPPLPRLNFAKNGLAPYKAYPWNFGLPTEAEIRDVVTGDAKGAGDLAKTADEVVAWFVSRRKGKVGVEDKVREVLSRKTKAGEEGVLRWAMK